MDAFDSKAREAARRLTEARYGSSGARVVANSLRQVPFVAHNSNITKAFGARGLGHFVYKFEIHDGQATQTEFVKLKVKADNEEVVEACARAYTEFDDELGRFFLNMRFKPFDNYGLRELKVLELGNPVIRKYSPHFLLGWQDQEARVSGFATEFLTDADVFLKDTLGKEHLWRDADIKVALDGFAHIHSEFLGRTHEIPDSCRVDRVLSENVEETIAWFKQKKLSSAGVSPEVFTPARVQMLDRALANLPGVMASFSDQDVTLCHGNAGLRNLCLRNTGAVPRLCAYDWEFATVHLPVRDIVEFLATLSFGNVKLHDRKAYFEYYRKRLEFHSDRIFNPAVFEQQIEFASVFFFFHLVLNNWVRGAGTPKSHLAGLLEHCFEVFGEAQNSKVFRTAA